MNKFIIATLFLFVGLALVAQDKFNLTGKWKLVKYDAFDKVKQSPAYLLGTEEEIQQYDNLVKLLLDSTTYDFRNNGTLLYSDVENQKLVKREARWIIQDSTLFITEINRPFKREAKILSLTPTQLIMSPIVQGAVGDSRMIFVPIK